MRTAFAFVALLAAFSASIASGNVLLDRVGCPESIPQCKVDSIAQKCANTDDVCGPSCVQRAVALALENVRASHRVHRALQNCRTLLRPNDILSHHCIVCAL